MARSLGLLSSVWSSAATFPVSTGAAMAYRTLFMTVRRLVVGRTMTVRLDGGDVTLTVTEFLILHSLAQRPGVVKSRDALMDAAYDEQVYVDDRTIDSHIKRLRKKFKMVDNDFDMIETLYGVGYRFRETA